MNSRRGAALLLSLWATAALAAAGIAQATRLSLELKWAGRLQEQDQSFFLSWTGLEVAAQLLAQDTELAWDAPQEPWAQPAQAPIPFEGGRFQYQITDEQARIPVNTASLELLQRLPGFTPEAAAALVARREAGQPLSHLGELSNLAGFQLGFLGELEPLVSVLASGPVNVNTASAEVLTALGLSAPLSAQIAAYRNGPDGAAGTADDASFADLETIVPDLEAALGPLLPEDQVALGNLVSSQGVGVRSSFFRVTLDGWSERHQVRKRVTAVLERGGQGDVPKVRGWHEND